VPEDVVILLPARLTRWKGQAFFIEALAGFEESESLRLVCLGDAQGRDAYRRVEPSSGIPRRAPLATRSCPGHGRSPMRQRTWWCARLWSRKRLGAQPRKLRRWAQPVIASNHGGAREVVAPGKTGWLATPGDPQAWRAALAEALGQSAQARQVMATAARQRITEQFSTAALQSATLRVYRELIE
jgi:glycosyltransferase involved in cell wall biosynthesis